MAIPPEIVQRVRDNISIVDVVSEYTKLNRSGRQHVGLCPFHTEKTPSFSVNDEEGVYYCFGCGKKGSIFDFIMEKRGLTFVETIKYLGARCGVSVPEDSNPDVMIKHKEQNALKQKLLLVTELAAKSYQFSLNHPKMGVAARAYIEGRGIGVDAINRFHLGYAPDSWDWILGAVLNMRRDVSGANQLKEEEVPHLLQQVGLVKERTSGGRYDLFRERMVFPIFRSDGRIIAFGGRIIATASSKGPKYLNSPESPIYSKRRTFYGIDQALRFITEKRRVYIVEGYLDLITMFQEGIGNVLATCGTAFTQDHIGILRRLVDEVVVVYDGDSAGRRAAAGIFESFVGSGLEARVCYLPQGHDPDSLVREMGQAESINILNNNVPALKAFLDHSTQTNDNNSLVSPTVAARAAEKVAQIIARSPSPVERELLARQTAELLGVGSGSLLSLISKNLRKNSFAKEGSPNSSNVSSKYIGARVGNNTVFQTANDEIDTNNKDRGKVVVPRAAKGRLTVTVDSRQDGGGESISGPEFQLICAVLREPSLASYLLSSEYSRDLRKLLPTNVLGFLECVDSEEIVPLEQVAWDGKLSQLPLLLRKGVELMKRNYLPAERLIKEARYQSKIGGSKPLDIARGVCEQLVRNRLRADMADLAQREGTDQNEEMRLKLAQEKAAKKRELEKLNNR